MEKYLAHTSEDGREQTIIKHLTETAKLCSEFASAFYAEDQGLLMGMTHDLGKYSDAFQQRIRGNPQQVDHSTAGAKECYHLKQPYAAFAVAGHHSGLPDGGGRGDPPDQSTFFARMNRTLENCDAWRSEISLPSAPPPHKFFSQSEGMFFTRMLYSCLVDADFLDTETFMNGSPVPRGNKESMAVLEQKLMNYISDWFPPKNPLNEQRCILLKHCLAQGEAQGPGLFTLTLPTGSGKTISSLAFALRHAKRHGLRRVIYVLPYTSIIEQNAKVFRDILGDDVVLEHHFGVQYDLAENADLKNIRLAKATENWDMPIVITTAVQFFESLFSNRSSKCRKLHNLAQSVIIFDEAQMLPVPYLRPCVFAISQLVKRYGVSAILCTATQPSLGPLFQEFLPGKPLIELCPSKTYQSSVFRRVTFCCEGCLSWEDLAQRLNSYDQVLCVLNSRKAAQITYSLLQEGAFHLSTLMCPAHRKAVLQEIRQRLATGLPCRVVSTSLIEAGVDVDFPIVFREEAGLDSILQAAGRCNREGKRAAEDSLVTVFRSQSPPPPLFQINIAAGRQVIDSFDRPDSPEAITRYFHELLDLNGKGGQDKKGILSLMEDSLSLMPFQTIAERFHLIESDTRTIYIPWKQGAELVCRLRSGERNRALFREAGQYCVSVYPNHFADLDRTGALEFLEDGSAILSDLTLYSESIGLPLNLEGGTAFFL